MHVQETDQNSAGRRAGAADRDAVPARGIGPGPGDGGPRGAERVRDDPPLRRARLFERRAGLSDLLVPSAAFGRCAAVRPAGAARFRGGGVPQRVLPPGGGVLFQRRETQDGRRRDDDGAALPDRVLGRRVAGARGRRVLPFRPLPGRGRRLMEFVRGLRRKALTFAARSNIIVKLSSIGRTIRPAEGATQCARSSAG